MKSKKVRETPDELLRYWAQKPAKEFVAVTTPSILREEVINTLAELDRLREHVVVVDGGGGRAEKAEAERDDLRRRLVSALVEIRDAWTDRNAWRDRAYEWWALSDDD